jgi:hypothetical protein
VTRALLAAAVLLIACNRAAKPEAPADTAARFVAKVKAELDSGERVFDTEASHAREVCASRTDIADCAAVVPRLPAPLPHP